MADPRPKYAKVNELNPEAWAQCDRCGGWFNRSDLVYQYQWGGMQLYSTGALVCTVGPRCYDTPNEQLRTIIIPPDPPPIVNARVPNFDYEEQTVNFYQFGNNQQGGNQSPPWGAGPQLEKCNQAGTQIKVLQYLTSS